MRKLKVAIAMTFVAICLTVFNNVAQAQQASAIYALVPFTGNNAPINVSGDQTREFEKKYQDNNPINSIISDWTLIAMEVVVMIVLVGVLWEIKKTLPRIEGIVGKR